MNKPINDIWQRAATVGAAGGGPSDVSIWRRGKEFWRVVRNQRRGGCNVCKEARELCKGCKNCNYENCGNCDNEEIHDLKESKSNKECICNSKGLELLEKKKKATAENHKLVHSLYLRREQKSPGKRYSPGERRRYGCFQPDFIWVIFRKFMNPIPDIPSNYISDWPWRWFLNEEKELERERWKEGLIRCPCGCPGWIHWEEEEEFMHWHH